MAVRRTPTGYAIVCGPRKPQKCAYCKEAGTQLCDFVVDAVSGATCDRPMCIKHAKRVAYQTDHCQEHPAAPPTT